MECSNDTNVENCYHTMAKVSCVCRQNFNWTNGECLRKCLVVYIVTRILPFLTMLWYMLRWLRESWRAMMSISRFSVQWCKPIASRHARNEIFRPILILNTPSPLHHFELIPVCHVEPIILCKYKFSFAKSFVRSLHQQACYVLNFVFRRGLSPRTFRKKNLVWLVQTLVISCLLMNIAKVNSKRKFILIQHAI